MSEGTSSVDEDHWQKTIDLPTGCRVRVDEFRSLVELPAPKIKGDCHQHEIKSEGKSEATSENHNASRSKWKAISSAIHKGGMRSFDIDKTNEISFDESKRVHVFNYKVPTSYDGLNPEPKSLLQTAIRNEFASLSSKAAAAATTITTTSNEENNTIGIMTAASMKSLRTATRSAGGIVVDVIVTAGISNARAAGAEADFFGILPQEVKPASSSSSSNSNMAETFDNSQNNLSPNNTGLKQRKQPPPGTINTVVVINGASLTQEAMIEAYAIAIEAKCGACAEYSVTCAKNARKLAQGTGTDCTVLLCPSQESQLSVNYAGKHCLLAELIGQAVKEATGEAILSNLHYLYGKHVWKHDLGRCLGAARAILEGARPCVPARPMDPVPRAPLTVLGLGWSVVFLCYGLYNKNVLPRSAAILLAAAAWDRCLPEPPLSIHPVVLAGTTISLATKQWIPETVFAIDRPLLGFCAGLAFLVGTVGIFVIGAQGFVGTCRWAEDYFLGTTPTPSSSIYFGYASDLMASGFWVLEVLLFKTTFSLQLLCTIALQMAGFLERSQLFEARAQLSWLCSRDPTHLNSEELAGGTLESLSENISDGTVAPWFWYVLLGPVGALGYRVANTLDSRIGYRGGRYEWFGKSSARFDDIINLIPARLTALLLCASAVNVIGCSHSLGIETAWKDRRQCSSPNAGWPMGAMAGILGVKLEKRGEYCLGKDIPKVGGPTPRDIRKGHRVAQIAGGIALVVAMAACSLREWIQ